MISILSAVFLAQPTPPSCDADVYRQFDFWLGTWDVVANGQTVGTNEISSEENGCLIVERWTSAQGGTGQSYNYYDPGTEKWRQVWVSRGFVIDYDGGVDEDGAMVLEGELTPRGGSPKQKFRGRWTPLDDGTVQQTFWTYNDDDETWVTWFDANYQKSKD